MARPGGRFRPGDPTAFKGPAADADPGAMFDVKDSLRELVAKDGSDLHLKVGSCPLHRIHGELTLDRRCGELTKADTEGALRVLLGDENKLEEFAEDHEVDFSYEIEGVARYRINAFLQRGAISMVCRAIPHRISTIEELSLPDVVRELAEEERRRVLRQDPDVILVGEMRDEETVQTALSAAETGHLVLSTIHTVDATESINRMLDFFPPHQHQQARSMIAGTVRGVISQRLVPGADGGRVAVCEILRMTGRVRDMILDPDQTGKLVEGITTGGYYGMQTFDQALYGHVKAGRVTFEDAMRVASSPHDFKLLMQAEGRRGTTMEDVASAETNREALSRPTSPSLAG